MDKKQAKAKRGKKPPKNRERVFEKDESDFFNEKEEKEKREKHMKIYGVPTFESEEEEEKPKVPLNEIKEEDEEGSDMEIRETKEKMEDEDKGEEFEKDTPEPIALLLFNGHLQKILQGFSFPVIGLFRLICHLVHAIRRFE